MSKFQGIKRIIKEDFSSKDQTLIEKLAYPINQLLEFVARAMNKGISLDDNINCQIKDLDITVDSTGTPKQTVNFKSELKSQAKGLSVLRAQNLDNPNTYVSGAPFISYEEASGQIAIKNVAGLQADNKYRLKVIAYA